MPLIDESFSHLGYPLILPPKNRSEAYSFILENFKSKLLTYKANYLSHATRVELINSIFSSISVNYMSNIIFSRKVLAKITRIIRNFWWNGVNSESASKTLCLIAWKNICTPKEEGGLGIQNLMAAIHGLILSTTWRIAERPKYFTDGSIWRPKSNIPKSTFWTSVLKVIHLLQHNSFYQICRGKISIWSSPWCSAWTKVYDDLIIRHDGFTYPAAVKDLWLPNLKRWNVPMIQSLFLQPTASAIISIPKPLHSSIYHILAY
jgi:hypothetical protein